MAKKKMEFAEVLKDAGPKVDEVLKEANKVLNSKKKGDKWCIAATPALVNASITKKWLEDTRKSACKPLKDQVKLIEKPVREILDQIALVDEEMRERVLVEYEGDGNIHVEEVGDLVFAETWDFEVEDPKSVDSQLLTVDRGKVMELIKGGVRSIEGIKVYKRRMLSVCKPGTVDYAIKKGLQR